MSKLVRLLSYLSSFFIARGLLFCSPLYLASSLPTESYAQLEWSLANATLATAVLTLGCGGLVPVVVCGNSPSISLRGIRWHYLTIAGVALVAAAISRLATHHAYLWQLPLLISVLTLMTLKSIELKTHEHASASLFVDALLLTSMAGLTFLGVRSPEATVNPWFAPITLTILFGASLVRDIGPRWRVPGLKNEWKRTIHLGVPLMLSGALATLITTSGRASIGWLRPSLAVADYAVLSRGAALPIVAHQIIVVGVYRQLFAASIQRLNRILVTIIGLVATAAVALWLVTPALGHYLGPAFARASTEHHGILVQLLAQSIVWSGIALNDMLNVRNSTAGAVLRWSTPSLLIILVLSWITFIAGPASLERFVQIHSIAMLSFFVCQTGAMWRLGVRAPHMSVTTGATFLAVMALSQLY